LARYAAVLAAHVIRARLNWCREERERDAKISEGGHDDLFLTPTSVCRRRDPRRVVGVSGGVFPGHAAAHVGVIGVVEAEAAAASMT
jgi:hypothetical protein